VTGIVLSVDQNIYAATLHQAKITIMPLKFLDSNGSGSTSNAIRAIYYAANNGASVMNNSWGGSSYSASLYEAISYAYSKGALFVAAAGNSGTNNDSAPMYPANYSVPKVLSVAATTDTDYRAYFSNYGKSTVNLGSPGVNILSTMPGDSFGSMSGTSMATPFVSGTAAQMKAVAPDMLGYQMKSILLSQGYVTSKLTDVVSTSARLNSSNAVNYATTASVDTTQPSYSLSYAADRQLASAMGGGGCGTVKALGGASEELPFGSGSGVVLALILAPLAVLLVMRMKAPAYRRRFERFKIDSDVRISVGDRELVGSLSSISLGGAQVNTSALLQDGGLITMSISSPSGDERVEVAGRVVWSEANKAYGVAFDQAPQTALSRIADWTKGLQKAS
jgi:subtilisin family serine protease